MATVSSKHKRPASTGGFQRYIPERELPEEIQQMPPEETRCQFCGVSYLVHHEVKKLEETVEDLRTQLNQTATTKQELLGSVKNERERSHSLEIELENFKERLVYKDTLLHQSLGLLQSTLETTQQWNVTVRDIKDHVSVTLRDNIASSQSVRHYCKLLQASLVREKQALVESADKQLKEITSGHESERLRLAKQLQLKDSIIEQVKEELTGQIRHCQEVESNLHKASEQIKVSSNEADKLVQQYNTIQQEMKKCDGQLKEKMSENASLQKEVADLRNKLEATRTAHVSEREQLSRDKEKTVQLTHQQLLEKDRQLVQLRAAIEREEQNSSLKITALEQQIVKLREEAVFHASEQDVKSKKLKELLKSEHNESLVKLKLSMERDKTMALESVKQCHENALIQYQRSSNTRIGQLERQLQDVNTTHELKIRDLEKSLYEEKQTFDAELSRHVSEEKQLRLSIDQYEMKLSQQQRLLEEFKEKVAICQEELVNKEKQISASFTGKTQELEQKLNTAYSEIADLQSIIERQVNERRELIERYTQSSSIK